MEEIKNKYEEDNMLTFTEQIDKILNHGNDDNVTSPWDVESLYEFQYFNCPTRPTENGVSKSEKWFCPKFENFTIFSSQVA